ncbi:hypothetical protein [Falsiroseomonas sp. CW058]|uniref:hypothetical protein n=1 Tax=Falsiroseomonas sp. CW058 TaxID=3388664 RepID=UPI003D31D8F7
MPDSGPEADPVLAARRSIARHIEDLHRAHLALAADARALKALTAEGNAQAEVELAAELLESYATATGAFMENMRGRFEARLPLIRRSEPRGPEGAEAHGRFWYAFSRLCVALKAAERRAG